MNLVFLGKQGVGKGTYAQRLSQIKKIPQLSTGDLFRQEIATGSELGKKLAAITTGGNLVPNELTSQILKRRMLQDDCKNGFILDGFPRNNEQVKLLDEILFEMGKKLDAVINFTASDDELMQRITGRRTCKKCGKIFNLKTLPPKKTGICDACGGELYHRDDDKPDAIKKRFAIYEQQTKPLTDEYRKKGLLTEIDGSRTPDVVVKELQSVLEKRLEK